MSLCECTVNERWQWTPEKLIELGLTESNDGSGSAWGIDWQLDTKAFHITVDPCGVVKLFRRNPDSDPVVIHVDDIEAFKSLMDFVQD